MSELYEKEIYEIICDECSKSFESEDIDATICNECWEKLVGANLTEEGK